MYDLPISRAIRAISISPAAEDWLEYTESARVLHVFEQVCNLVNNLGQVLSLVTTEIGNGPFNLVIAGPAPSFASSIRAESKIKLAAGGISVEKLAIKARDVRRWFPQPNWARLHSAREAVVQHFLDLEDCIQPRILIRYPGRGAFARLSAVAQTANNLPLAIVAGDVGACRNAARSLAGKGIGLTPSGDDFILGAIYAAWIMHPREKARSIANAMADAAGPKTTTLSAAWLRAAGRGEAGEWWHNLFSSLLMGDELAVRISIERLLALGQTSGADALTGFLRTLTYCTVR